MRVLNLLTTGNIGGIETLCRDISAISLSQNCLCFMFGGGLIYEQMKKIGSEVYLFDEKKLSLGKLIRLVKIASACDIIIVHNDDPFLYLYYLALMKILPQKKYITMVHHCYDPLVDNPEYGLIKRSIKKSLIKKILKKPDRLIFVSNAGYKSYKASFEINEEKVSIVYNGISASKLNNGKNCRKDHTDVIRMAYVGRLVEIKGVDKLIETLPKLGEKYNILLSVVGDGRCRKKLEKQVEEAGLGDKVVFYGFQEEVEGFFERADIFIYPSSTEIFGLSIVEAMAYKCICVANNVGGIPEIINNGVNGFLNMTNDARGLYETVLEAIRTYREPDRYRSMVREAERTAEKFTVHETMRALEDIYKETVRSQ